MGKSLCFMLQARVGSTRLPKKMTLPFFDSKPILELLLEKLQKNFPEITLILATSDKAENNVLAQIAESKNCAVYRGSESDVLRRFIDAADFFEQSNVIRVCADNPFLDVAELHRLVARCKEDSESDYISFEVNGTPSIKTHFGFWTEYVTLKALKKTSELTEEPLYREHVTNFIYANPAEFKIDFLQANPVVATRNDIRMTLDTLADFSVLSEIYLKLHEKYNGIFGINEIISFLDDHVHYKEVMLAQIIENTK